MVAPALNFNIEVVKTETESGIGGILFIGNNPPSSALSISLHGAIAASSSVPAPMLMVDEEGGGVQRLAGAVTSIPWARQIVQTLTPAQTEELADKVGRQMKQLGITVDLAPVLDVDGGNGPSPADADGLRSFSDIPSVATGYGIAFLDGLKASGVIPVIKHFPGLGDSTGDTDYEPADTPPLSTLQTSGLLPFQAAINAGAPAVMIANASVPGLTEIPAALSPQVIQGLLERQLGFNGLVVTDSLSAGAISQAGYSVPQAAVKAIVAGADMILFGSTLTPAQISLLSPTDVQHTTTEIISGISAAVSDGTISESRLNDAVISVLTAKGTNLCTTGT